MDVLEQEIQQKIRELWASLGYEVLEEHFELLKGHQKVYRWTINARPLPTSRILSTADVREEREEKVKAIRKEVLDALERLERMTLEE